MTLSLEWAARTHGLRCRQPGPTNSGITCGLMDFLRTSGDCLCPECGAEYRRHPYCANSLAEQWACYTLHVLCNGRHVKL